MNTDHSKAMAEDLERFQSRMYISLVVCIGLVIARCSVMKGTATVISGTVKRTAWVLKGVDELTIGASIVVYHIGNIYVRSGTRPNRLSINQIRKLGTFSSKDDSLRTTWLYDAGKWLTILIFPKPPILKYPRCWVCDSAESPSLFPHLRLRYSPEPQ